MNVEQVNAELKECDDVISMGEALERLAQNKDFKKVVMDGYFKEYVSDMVCHLDFPEVQEQRDYYLKAIKGVSALSLYFKQTSHAREIALKSKEELLIARTEIMTEED